MGSASVLCGERACEHEVVLGCIVLERELQGRGARGKRPWCSGAGGRTKSLEDGGEEEEGVEEGASTYRASLMAP